MDAQASDVRTGIGGRFPRRDEGGTINVKESPWFSLEVVEEDWPWGLHEEPESLLGDLDS